VETFSDVPIRFSKPIRQRLLQFPKASKKGLAGTLGLLKGLKLKDLAPEAPSIQNFTTGEVMVSYNYLDKNIFVYAFSSGPFQ
jgi:acetyl-CoA acyltransferase